MKYLIGNYYLKMDAKNRVAIPSALKQQLPGEGKSPLVISKGLGKFLVIYTKADWESKLSELMKLSEFSREHQEFVRRFTNGAVEVEPDTAQRLLLPKFLTDFAGIDNKTAPDVVLNCVLNKVEVWEQKAYDQMMNDDSYDLGAQAEKLMVNNGATLLNMGRRGDE
jgi:MraZ protein